MEVIEIKSEEFNEKISSGKVLVDCYANWCGPCKMLAPIIEELAKENSDVNFYKLDIDNAEEVARQYNIMSIPTLLIFEDGKLKDISIGLKSKTEIEGLIK